MLIRSAIHDFASNKSLLPTHVSHEQQGDSLLSNRLLLRPSNLNSIQTFNTIATSVTIANIADMVTTATIATMATSYNGNHYVGCHNSIAHSCRSPWCTTGPASYLHICLSSRFYICTSENQRTCAAKLLCQSNCCHDCVT